MKNIRSVFALTFGLVTFLAVCVLPAEAVPFTDYFDSLITDLQSREITLSGSTDNVQRKQLKIVKKVIRMLENKKSKSVGTDIQSLGTVSKLLVRVFPDEFGPSGGPLNTELESALEGLIGEVQADIDATQTLLNGLGGVPCAVKAQTTLDTASNLVAEASAAADFATAARLLHRGFESAKRANTATIKCSSKSTGGGGKGDFIKCTIKGNFNADFSCSPSSIDPPAAEVAPGLDLVTIFGANFTASSGSAVELGIGVSLSNVTGPGSYPALPSSSIDQVYTTGTNIFYFFTSGTITFTTFDLANHQLAGTFSFTATEDGGSGTVTVTNGSFSISNFVP